MQIPASPARRHAVRPSAPSTESGLVSTVADDAPVLFPRGIVWCMRGDGDAVDAPLCHWLPPPPRAARGGLSGWQRKAVADHIETNLGAALRLVALAQIVRLSPYHFARGFKQSFGVEMLGINVVLNEGFLEKLITIEVFNSYSYIILN